MKTFYLYTLLLLSLGCKAQEFDLRSMKRFDEKVFKDWEVDTSFSSIPNTKFLKKGNDKVKITKGDKIIEVELSNATNSYTYLYTYDAKQKRQVSRGEC